MLTRSGARANGGSARASLVTSLMIVVLLALLPACMSEESASPDPSPTPTFPLPNTLPSVTPTIGPSPTPTYTAALEAILSPGNTAALPASFYFRTATDIWRMRADGSERPRRVASDLRIGPWAQTPNGEQAAIVTYIDIDGRGAEEIRLVRGDQMIEPPLYGPVTISGAEVHPTITSIAWSWDGTKLALSFADGTLGIVSVPTDPNAFPVEAGALERPGGTTQVAGLSWSPNGAGVAYITTTSDDRDLLYITPAGDIARPVIETRPVRTFEWMPGRGRIAFVEASGGPANRLPGSVLTVAPDGQLLELLLSAGRFAPAATITAIDASPDGREMAVTVAVPDTAGRPRFHSLWIFGIDSGELREVSVAAGFRVVETWWTSAGLVWRGIDMSAGTSDGSYTGAEPFVLGRWNGESATSAIIFQQ